MLQRNRSSFRLWYVFVAVGCVFILSAIRGYSETQPVTENQAPVYTVKRDEATRPKGTKPQLLPSSAPAAVKDARDTTEVSQPSPSPMADTTMPSPSSSTAVAKVDPLIPLPAAGVVARHSWLGGSLPAVDTSRVPGRRMPLLPSLAGVSGDWHTAPVELQGQVTLTTTFGAALNELASRPEVRLVLESGTWYGGGSSWCIAQALRAKIQDPSRPDAWLMTMEIFQPAHEYASQTLSRLPVTCLRGGTVGLEGYMAPSEMTAEDVSGAHFQLYYERDKTLAATSPKLLPALCAAYDFDFVLLDGNEYTGWSEFEVVSSVCKPRYLGLHDCGTLKTRKVQAWLDARPAEWKLIKSGMDGAAWAIYEHVGSAPQIGPSTSTSSGSGSTGSTGSSTAVAKVDPLIPLPAAGVVAPHSWLGGSLPAVDTSRVPGRRMPLLPSLAGVSGDWHTAPVELQGQVTLTTTFGAALNELASRPEVRLVLESGTWYGGGSSWCIAQALRAKIQDPSRPDAWLMTMEIFQPAHEYASQTLSRLPVTCLRGGTVGLEGYMAPSEMTAEDVSGAHFQLYYERDKTLAATSPKLLPALCAAYDFDFVLLDGNEYTGWSEFEVVSSVCKPRYLGLHDCGTLKTRKVQAWLDARPAEWKLIKSGMDGAAWAIYEHVGSAPQIGPSTSTSSGSGSTGSTGSSTAVAKVDPLIPLPAAGVVAPHSWLGGSLPAVDTSRVPGRRMPLLPSLAGVSGDWHTAPVELQGQVTLTTTFGAALNELASRPEVRLVLESGTWYGGGSSWCIAQALRAKIQDPSRPDAWLMTMEIFQPAHEYASQTLSRLPVTCLRGGTVGLEGYMAPSEMTAEDVSGAHFQLYYERDKTLAATSPKLLPALCAAYDFDFVLLDGNEYTGWSEFEVVSSVCKPRYLGLHDCGTLKTRKVQAWLDARPAEWKLIKSGMDGAAWAIYEHVGSAPQIGPSTSTSSGSGSTGSTGSSTAVAKVDPLIPLPAAGVVARHSWLGGSLPAVDTSRVPGRRMPLLPSLAGVSGDWHTAPVELQGQVTLTTTFGAALNELASRPEVRLVLESGTWYGGGSSWCIAQALRAKIQDPSRPDAWLMTMEIFQPAHEYASQTLSRLPVTCLRGGTVGLEGYMAPSEMTAEDVSGAHFQLYYERDKTLAATSPKLLPALCAAYDFDFVLLDGNEYTGWSEFEVVSSVCKPRYLGLHDCGTLKTRKVQAWLDARPAEWKLIKSGMDGAAWAIYEHVGSTTVSSPALRGSL